MDDETQPYSHKSFLIPQPALCHTFCEVLDSDPEPPSRPLSRRSQQPSSVYPREGDVASSVYPREGDVDPAADGGAGDGSEVSQVISVG